MVWVLRPETSPRIWLPPSVTKSSASPLWMMKNSLPTSPWVMIVCPDLGDLLRLMALVGWHHGGTMIRSITWDITPCINQKNPLATGSCKLDICSIWFDHQRFWIIFFSDIPGCSPSWGVVCHEFLHLSTIWPLGTNKKPRNSWWFLGSSRLRWKFSPWR
jgi:hypothetical protein